MESCVEMCTSRVSSPMDVLKPEENVKTAIYDNQLVVYGGRDYEDQVLNKMSFYNIVEQKWTVEQVKGQLPTKVVAPPHG